MSLSARQRSTNAPKSWYGEPQHEVHIDDEESIEFARYGEPNHEQPSDPIEFVSGIEYHPPRTIGKRKRPMVMLRIGGN